MSEPVRPDVPATEVEVDLAAFLPEGTTLAGADTDSVEGEVPSPEFDDGPEVPAWALDDAPAGPVAPAVVEPAVESVPAGVDLARLESLAADLAAVDRALDALDAGTPERSPLLVELLGTDPAP